MPESDDDAIQELLVRASQDRRFGDILERLAADASKKRAKMSDPEHHLQLRELVASYLAPHEKPFEPGDSIVWKTGLKNRRLPDYGVPIVVVEVLEAPIRDSESNTGSQYYRDPLTIRAAALDEDEDLLMWHFDGSRFTHYEPDGTP